MLLFRSAMRISSVLALITLSGFAASSLAGPLSPPAGPVASTGKTLTEVEPRTVLSATNTPGDADSVFKITQPGSYSLTGNLSVPSGKSGIEIASDRVTIDLNGFAITGAPGSLYGVFVSGSRSMITVRNGLIKSMGEYGVDLYAAPATDSTGHLVENLTVSSCGGGISIDSGMVRNSSASDCTNYGIDAYGWTSGSIIVDSCIANRNGNGIRVGNGTVRASCARKNQDTGITAGNTGLIDSCHSEDNQWGYGGSKYILRNSVAEDNSMGGAYSNDASVMVGNLFINKTLVAGSIGVRVNNSSSRLEGNNIVRFTTGMLLTSTNNLVIQNSFTACPTAMSAVAGNRIGTLTVGTASAAINGNSGGGLGTTDPNANVVY